MSSGLKKTLYFAVEDTVEVSKTVAKYILLENVSLRPIDVKNDKTYNIFNVKLLPDEEGVMELEFDQLEQLLSEQAKDYQKAFQKRYPNSMMLQEKDVNKISDKFESDREERLTVNLNPEQKMVRAALVGLKKKFNLLGTESSFVSNIFDDILSLKLIDEDTVIGNQKKTINSVFPDKRFMVSLIVDEIEALQGQVAALRSGKPFEETSDVKQSLSIKGQWPDWREMAKSRQDGEDAAAVLAASQKRGRGRPKKTNF